MQEGDCKGECKIYSTFPTICFPFLIIICIFAPDFASRVLKCTPTGLGSCRWQRW